MIIRTSWLYGKEGKNFLNTMLSLGKTKESLSVVCDQVGSPTYVDHLAMAIMHAIGDRSCLQERGVYHVSNEGVASWYDFALAIFELSNIEIDVEPVPTSAFPTLAKRPQYSVLSKEAFKKRFNLAIPHWRAGLKSCLNQN